MVFEKILYVFLYHPGKFFDCERDHIQETCVTNTVDVEDARDSCFDLGRQNFQQRAALTSRSAQQVTLFASPNHGDGSREAATHVEREESFCVLDLASTGSFRELLIRFENLANTCRPDRVTVSD